MTISAHDPKTTPTDAALPNPAPRPKGELEELEALEAPQSPREAGDVHA
jgi:hypothetical protein